MVNSVIRLRDWTSLNFKNLKIARFSSRISNAKGGNSCRSFSNTGSGTGHRAQWVIAAAEIENQTTNETAPSRPAQSGVAAKTAPDTKAEKSRASEAVAINPAELQKMIETALDKKLKPVMKMLVASQNQRRTFKDIMGGMGYIFGLVGVATYFRYRRNKDFKLNDDQ